MHQKSRKIAVVVAVVFAVTAGTSCNRACDREQVADAVNRLFIAVDGRVWHAVRQSFGESVLLDYSSLTGMPAGKLAPDTIVANWKGLLPGFDSTQHQTGNFIVTVDGDAAKSLCYGTAMHYLKGAAGGDVWTVVGTYEFGLQRESGVWKIVVMKYNHKFMTGNAGLPELAQARAAKRGRQ